jgi:enediyne biosynthesis protein E4
MITLHNHVMLRKLVALVLIASVEGCSSSAPPVPVAAPPRKSSPRIATPERFSPRELLFRFRDASERSGITFAHCSGNSPEKEFPTCLGSGVALLDFDGDGRLDIYFATTRNLPLDAPNRSQGNRLFRNRGGATFEDVTERAGVGFRGFCHGVTVGDVDNNGFPDLFLTNYGSNVLYLNNGDGTFRDATEGAKLGPPSWSCGAAFLDYDGDGWLDLYVSNYGTWPQMGPHPFCGDSSRNLRMICTPDLITPARHVLYRNRGDGSFEDRTQAAGILRDDGRGMGVVAADFNGDGKIDIYIANDKCPNFLFLNRGDGTFEDASESSGAAFSGEGAVQGSMGVDAEDLDGDALPELIVTNFRGDGSTLYQNLGRGAFSDVSSRAGILGDSRPYVGWGCSFSDFDGDGWLDLFNLNGHVDDNLREFGQDVPQPEPALIWRQTEPGRFRRIRDAGSFFLSDHVGRGAAFGDLDDDGDIDIVAGILDGRPIVLVNESPRHSWIRFALTGRPSNRSAIGALISVHCGTRVIHRQVKGGGSYLSANDPRILIGLGDLTKVDRVEIRWPSGTRTFLSSPEIGRTHLVNESATHDDAVPPPEVRR